MHAISLCGCNPTPRPLTVCKSEVSGSLSLPFRGSFHLSLTVLFTIGHQACLALRCGQRRFPQDSACPGVLGCRSKETGQLSSTGLSPSVALVSTRLRLTAGFVTPRQPGRAGRTIPQHRVRNGRRLGTHTV